MTDDLLITECPAAFAEFARKHNGIVYLLQAMSGAGGISVAAADANIIIDGSACGGGSGGSITYTQVALTYPSISYTSTVLTVCVGGSATAVTFITGVSLVSVSPAITFVTSVWLV